MLHDGQSLAAPAVEVAGFGNENTRGHGAGYQDRWVAGSGAAGAWLAVADGIGGGPAGKEAAQVAVGLAQVVLGAGELTEAGLYQLFDSAFVALRPWWVQERGGGTTLTVAAISRAGLLMGAVGDSPAYVDFGAGFELVTKPKRSHRHCCIERSRGCLAVNLAARRRSTSAGRLLVSTSAALIAPSGTCREGPTGRSVVPASYDGSMQQCPTDTHGGCTRDGTRRGGPTGHSEGVGT